MNTVIIILQTTINPISLILATAGATILLLASVIGFFLKFFFNSMRDDIKTLFSYFDSLKDELGKFTNTMTTINGNISTRDSSCKFRHSGIDKRLNDIEEDVKTIKKQWL